MTLTQIRVGQALLITCCIFYLIWWGVAFHPDQGEQHMNGIKGILFAITALFGLSGVAVNLIGIRDSGAEGGFTSGGKILIAGIILYLVLLFGTRLLFHRQVTTELFLIVGWTMLEIASANTAFALGSIPMERVVLFLIIVALAAVSSFVFYMLYYSVEPMRGYYYGMIPLITEALSMGIFELLVRPL